MSRVLEALTEITMWAGVTAGGAALLVAVAIYLADGVWLPARGVVEHTDRGPVIRWFDEDGTVNEAPLLPHDVAATGGRDMADIWYRRGWLRRMRFTSYSPAARGIRNVGCLLAGIGIAAFVGQIVLLALRG